MAKFDCTRGIPDIFMRKVEKDEYWHLMCPHECPGLTDVYGEEFDKLYIQYVEQSKFRKKIKLCLKQLYFPVSTLTHAHLIGL